MSHQLISGSGGGKSGSGGGSAPVEAPNTLQSKTTVRILDLVSEGPIDGLVDGAKSIFINNTPLQNADDTYNFSGVVWDARAGLPDQSPFPGFAKTESETVVSVEVKHATPVVRTATNPDATSLRVAIRLPALTKQDTSNGNLNGSSVTLKIEIQSSESSYQTMAYDTISGKTTSVYERAYNIPLFGTGPWNIKVTKITEDATEATEVNGIVFYSFTEIIDHNLIYPDSAIVGVAADAQYFGGQIPLRAYEIFGLQVKVPDNYDENTGEYTGIWDGTFKIAWTNNPAWILYDILTNERYGLGDSIEAAQVDKWSFYEIGAYCDELVENGFGGYEPRYTFNGIIQSRDDAYKVVQSICSAFRGMTYWASGAIAAVADMPSDATQLVTPANVIDGRFEYQGTALKARHTVALVTWNDPSDGYLQSIEVVEDVEGIDRYGVRQIEVAALGCTSRGLARRLGRWILDSERNETETVTYQASFDHANVSPGEIIKIADPAYAGVRFGGRVVAYDADEKVITLDGEIDLDPDETYSISVVMPNGTISTVSAVSVIGPLLYHTMSGIGPTSSLVLDEALDDEPVPGAVWVLTGTNVEPRTFRVIAIQETEKNIFNIVAIFHDTTKYERIEQNLTVEKPVYTTLPAGPLGVPSGLNITESISRGFNSITSSAVFSWATSADSRVTKYEASVLRPGETGWVSLGITDQPSIDVLETVPGEWGFRTRSLSGGGGYSIWAETTVTLLANLAPLTPRVTGLELVDGSEKEEFIGRDAIFRWREGLYYNYGLDNPNGADAAQQESFFAGYRVTITASNGDVLRQDTVIDPFFTYTFEMNLSDSRRLYGFNSNPQRSFSITVQQIDKRSSETTYSTPQTLSVSNPAPLAPSAISFEPFSRSAWITLSLNGETDIAGVIVKGSTSSGFNVETEGTVLFNGNTFNRIPIAITPGINTYCRVSAYDTFGNDTPNWSSEFTVNSQAITSDEFDDALTAAFETAQALPGNYVVKLDSGGRVTGFALVNEGGVDSETTAGFLVDKFLIAHPDVDGGTPSPVFIVEDGVVKINNAFVEVLTADQLNALFVSAGTIFGVTIATPLEEGETLADAKLIIDTQAPYILMRQPSV